MTLLDPSAWLIETRQAARRLLRHPGSSSASVVTLALGIAAATAVFALVYGVVLSPLPYPQSDRIVELDHSATRLDVEGGLGMTYGFYRFYEERLRGAQSMAMYSEHGATLAGEGEPARVRALRATPSLARVLGVEPVHGRWFTEAEGGVGEPQTVVLSHGIWRDRFASDPSVLGSTVLVEDVPHQVVGIMPPSFAFPDEQVDLWVPREVPATGIGGWNVRAVARLAPGQTPKSLESEITSVLPLLREFDDGAGRVRSYLDEAGVVPRVRTLREAVVGDVRATLWVLLGTVGFVLLVALANVANLFLVRAEEGMRDTALRRALGAGRTRILQGRLAETLLVTGTAGVAGIALAAGAVRVVRARAPMNLPRLQEVGLDPAVLGVAAGVAVLAALALALLPELRGGAGVAGSIQEGTGRATAGRRAGRGRNVLVASQVALALVLLVGSGLLLRTFSELRAVELGFSEDQALTFRIALPPASYVDRAAAARFHQELEERLGAIPGVRSAGAVASCLPLSGNLCWGEQLTLEDGPAASDGAPIVTGTRAVSPAYFGAIGIPIVRGRGIEESDRSGGAPVAVLSESAAAAHFPDEDPLGRRVSFGGDLWYTVVGVAGDVRTDISAEGLARLIYVPVLEDGTDGPPPHDMAYVLATSVPPSTLARSVREAVAELDPGLPVAEMASLEDRVDRATAPAAFALTLMGLAGLMSLLLGTVGVYAVTAYAVSRRTAEIGVRVALGARPLDVGALVVRRSGSSVVVGLGLGLAAAIGLTRFMTGMLYGIRPTDPLTYALAAALMTCVAGLALWVPARRAARLDPAVALRTE